jgi:hypothetical protein
MLQEYEYAKQAPKNHRAISTVTEGAIASWLRATTETDAQKQ